MGGSVCVETCRHVGGSVCVCLSCGMDCMGMAINLELGHGRDMEKEKDIKSERWRV